MSSGNERFTAAAAAAAALDGACDYAEGAADAALDAACDYADALVAGLEPGGGGGSAFAVGAYYFSSVATNPATLLGYGTWVSAGSGRVLIGLDPNDTDFDTAGAEAGAKTATPAGSVSQPTFTGAALASHSHTYTDVVNHTHAVSVNDPGHTHTQDAHNHTQNAHTHTLPVGATDDTAAPFDRADAGTNTSGANASTSVGSTTATNQAATAVNQSAATGVTATTSNPAGAGASGTTATTSGGTPAGTVSQPTFTGTPHSILPPYLVCYIWLRTA